MAHDGAVSPAGGGVGSGAVHVPQAFGQSPRRYGQSWPQVQQHCRSRSGSGRGMVRTRRAARRSILPAGGPPHP